MFTATVDDSSTRPSSSTAAPAAPTEIGTTSRSQADFYSTTKSDVVAKLTFFNETAVEQMADNTTQCNMCGLLWHAHGCFHLCRVGPRQRGWGCPSLLKAATLDALVDELTGIFNDNLQAARAKAPTRAKQSAASKVAAIAKALLPLTVQDGLLLIGSAGIMAGTMGAPGTMSMSGAATGANKRSMT